MPGNPTAHESITYRCFLPDLTELGDESLRGTWLHVELSGIEPLTCTLRTYRSPN